MRTVTDGSAHVEMVFEDPTSVDYKIEISDLNGNPIGEGLDTLRGALEEWTKFIADRPDMRTILE